MAAEASTDAQLPVYLALAKLALDFILEFMSKNYHSWEQMDKEVLRVYIIQRIGPDWDIYLITALSGILFLLLLFRRGLRQ